MPEPVVLPIPVLGGIVAVLLVLAVSLVRAYRELRSTAERAAEWRESAEKLRYEGDGLRRDLHERTEELATAERQLGSLYDELVERRAEVAELRAAADPYPPGWLEVSAVRPDLDCPEIWKVRIYSHERETWIEVTSAVGLAGVRRDAAERARWHDAPLSDLPADLPADSSATDASPPADAERSALEASVAAVIRRSVVARWMGENSFVEGYEEAAAEVLELLACRDQGLGAAELPLPDPER